MGPHNMLWLFSRQNACLVRIRKAWPGASQYLLVTRGTQIVQRQCVGILLCRSNRGLFRVRIARIKLRYSAPSVCVIENIFCRQKYVYMIYVLIYIYIYFYCLNDMDDKFEYWLCWCGSITFWTSDHPCRINGCRGSFLYMVINR